jgi:hypothetical protein
MILRGAPPTSLRAAIAGFIQQQGPMCPVFPQAIQSLWFALLLALRCIFRLECSSSLPTLIVLHSLTQVPCS